MVQGTPRQTEGQGAKGQCQGAQYMTYGDYLTRLENARRMAKSLAREFARALDIKWTDIIKAGKTNLRAQFARKCTVYIMKMIDGYSAEFIGPAMDQHYRAIEAIERDLIYLPDELENALDNFPEQTANEIILKFAPN